LYTIHLFTLKKEFVVMKLPRTNNIIILVCTQILVW